MNIYIDMSKLLLVRQSHKRLRRQSSSLGGVPRGCVSAIAAEVDGEPRASSLDSSVSAGFGRSSSARGCQERVSHSEGWRPAGMLPFSGLRRVSTKDLLFGQIRIHVHSR